MQSYDGRRAQLWRSVCTVGVSTDGHGRPRWRRFWVEVNGGAGRASRLADRRSASLPGTRAAGTGPVNLFLGPPYLDLERRPEALLRLIADLQAKVAPGSVLVVQAEKQFAPEQLPAAGQWDVRTYGRNRLLIWVKEEAPPPAP